MSSGCEARCRWRVRGRVRWVKEGRVTGVVGRRVEVCSYGRIRSRWRKPGGAYPLACEGGWM